MSLPKERIDTPMRDPSDLVTGASSDELDKAEAALRNATEYVEQTALNFGIAIQQFERVMLELADNDETREQVQIFSSTLKTLPQSAIHFAKIANDSFRVAASTIREKLL